MVCTQPFWRDLKYPTCTVAVRVEVHHHFAEHACRGTVADPETDQGGGLKNKANKKFCSVDTVY